MEKNTVTILHYHTYTILYFRIPHNTLCLPPQILHKPLFSNALGTMQCPHGEFENRECVPTLRKYPVSPQSPLQPPPPPPAKNPVSLHFFNLNIPYPDRFSAFWLRLVSQPRATLKYHCIT